MHDAGTEFLRHCHMQLSPSIDKEYLHRREQNRLKSNIYMHWTFDNKERNRPTVIGPQPDSQQVAQRTRCSEKANYSNADIRYPTAIHHDSNNNWLPRPPKHPKTLAFVVKRFMKWTDMVHYGGVLDILNGLAQLLLTQITNRFILTLPIYLTFGRLQGSKAPNATKLLLCVLSGIQSTKINKLCFSIP